MERSKRITSSKFHEVIKTNGPATEQRIKRIWPRQVVQTAYMKLGIENEKLAVQKYLSEFPNYQFYKSGLCINPGVPFLASSPDGLIYNSENKTFHLLEIKTLVKGGLLMKKSVRDCITTGLAPFLEIINGTIPISEKKSRIFYANTGPVSINWLTILRPTC